MSSLRAILHGFAQSLSSLGVVLVLWVATVVVALPASLMLAEGLREDLGDSLQHQDLRDGFDMDWYSELQHRRGDLAEALEPSRLVAAGSFLDNAEAWLRGDLFRKKPALLAMGALYGLLWAFFLGGALDRFARPAQYWNLSRTAEACGRFAGRMIRLALVGAPLYFLVYAIARWLLERVAQAAEAASSETPVLLAMVASSLVVAIALVAVRTILDYGKVILVTEERSSAVGAALSGLGFVLRHPLKAAGIQGGFLLLGIVPVILYHYFGPGTDQASVPAILLALLAGQAVLFLRIYLRLALLAGQMAAYRYEERR